VAVLPALALHSSLGAGRKAARLRYLASYWRTRVSAALPEVSFYTDGSAEMSCALTTVEWPGMDPKAMQQRLRQRDGILVQAMTGNSRATEIRGLRVSPNVYTSLGELDRFVAAVKSAAGN
jgi:selenocysteine lyase/cysteine desulfurase